MMPVDTHCAVCRSPLPDHGIEGRCPSCLILSALGGDGAGGLGEIGGHELMEEIARGGMGVVYRARQRQPGREVALKSILGGWLSAPEARERFRLEVRAMAGLEHPAILPVYQVGEEDGVPFFTMKLAEGGTLSGRHADFAGKWREIAMLFVQVVDAVRFAHERGVLHRDLKPGNILFDGTGRIFVSDFGLAKLVDAQNDITLSAAILGTPHYLAPEIATHDSPATTSTDVWSLGVMLYELLAQIRPFRSASIPSLLREIAERAPQPLPCNVPRDLAVIAMKALAKDPAKRFITAGELADDLRSWLDGKPIKARPVSSFEKAVLWLRRNPVPAAAITVVATTLGLAGGLLWRSNHELRHSLAESFVAQAALARSQPRAATRSEVLRLLHDAVRLEPDASADQRATWRAEAASALALPEISETKRLNGFTERNSGAESFSADLARFVTAQPEGRFAVFESATGKPIRSFAPPAGKNEEWRDFSSGQFRLSPDGTMVAAGFVFESSSDSKVRIYEVQSGSLVREIPGRGKQMIWPEWGQHASDGFFTVDLQGAVVKGGCKGADLTVLPGDSSTHLDPSQVYVSRDGRAFAIRTSDPLGVAVWSLGLPGEPAVRRWFLPMLAEPSAIAWSADGTMLALGESEPQSTPGEESGVRDGYEILVVGAANGAILDRLAGHSGPVYKLGFSGNSVLSAGADERLIWQSLGAGFRIVMPAQDRLLQVSSDGTRLAYSPVKGELAIANLVSPEGGKPWTGSGSDHLGTCLGATTDGRTLVVSTASGLQLWDGPSGTLRQSVPWPQGYEASWPWFEIEPDGSSIIASQRQHPTVFRCLWRFPIGPDGRMSTPQAMEGTSPWDGIHSFSADGKGWIVGGITGGTRTGDALDFAIWPDGDPKRSRVLLHNVVAAGLHICSPDDHFGITASQHQIDAHVWDLTSGKKVRSLGYTTPVTCIYASDRRTVAVISPEESAIWETAAWRKRAIWPTPPGGEGFTPHFSPDGRRIAQFDRDGHVVFHLSHDGSPFLTLVLPQGFSPREFVWLGNDRIVVMGRGGRLFEWDLGRLELSVRANGLPW